MEKVKKTGDLKEDSTKSWDKYFWGRQGFLSSGQVLVSLYQSLLYTTSLDVREECNEISNYIKLRWKISRFERVSNPWVSPSIATSVIPLPLWRNFVQNRSPFIIQYMKLILSSFKEVKAWKASPRYCTPEPVIFSHILLKNNEKCLIKILLESETDNL